MKKIYLPANYKVRESSLCAISDITYMYLKSIVQGIFSRFYLIIFSAFNLLKNNILPKHKLNSLSLDKLNKFISRLIRRNNLSALSRFTGYVKH